MRPNFLLIGAARSGTTWIANNLSEHPDIYLPPQKELHFFDKDYQKGIAYYEQYFRNKNQKRIGEATPAYLYFPQIPNLIQKHLPDVKLIAALRNPIDRAYSHYLNLIAKNKRKDKNHLGSFEDELQKNPRLIEEGCYYEMLSRYDRIFPEENILVLIYEDMLTDPIQFMKKIYAFLEVDTSFIPSLTDQRLNASSTKLGKHQILYSLHRLLLKKLNLKKAAAYVENLNAKPVPTMKTETRNYLRSIYSEQVELLEKRINRDLAIWK